MTVPIRSPRLRLARLEGENMLQFRHGDDMYLYCEECQNSAYTPVSNTLGCTIGDDPEVVEYSQRFEEDPNIEDTEKCPGFEPRQETGTLEASRDDYQGVDDAGVINDAVDLFGMMEGGKVEEIKDKQQRRSAVIRILHSWNGGVLAGETRYASQVDNIYENYLEWKRHNVL